jgi:hypothetical protein
MRPTPSAEPEDATPADAVDPDDLGERTGLGLVCGLGVLVGALTDGGLLVLHASARGAAWPVPIVLALSVLGAVAGYVVLGRRLGPRCGDWFVLGYTAALVALALVVVGSEGVDVLRRQLAQVASG